jgi:hypothetical protein
MTENSKQELSAHIGRKSSYFHNYVSEIEMAIFQFMSLEVLSKTLRKMRKMPLSQK